MSRKTTKSFLESARVLAASSRLIQLICSWLAASFRFLLAREPKESILSRFELPVIERYFPEYPEEIRGRLG